MSEGCWWLAGREIELKGKKIHGHGQPCGDWAGGRVLKGGIKGLNGSGKKCN